MKKLSKVDSVILFTVNYIVLLFVCALWRLCEFCILFGRRQHAVDSGQSRINSDT